MEVQIITNNAVGIRALRQPSTRQRVAIFGQRGEGVGSYIARQT